MNELTPFSVDRDLVSLIAGDILRQRHQRRDFVHDLRSPLTAIQLAAETLYDSIPEGFERQVMAQLLVDVARLGERLGTRPPLSDTGSVATAIATEVKLAAEEVSRRGVRIEFHSDLSAGAEVCLPALITAMIGHLIWVAGAAEPDHGLVSVELSECDGALDMLLSVSQGSAMFLKGAVQSISDASDGRIEALPTLPGDTRHCRHRLRILRIENAKT